VYLVLAFHAGLHHFRGGFIGVDVFTFLSGFLVTSILLREPRVLGPSRIRSALLPRRVRRILPAAVVTLLITAVAYAAIASPSEMLDRSAVPCRVPLRRELVLHRPGDRITSRRA